MFSYDEGVMSTTEDIRWPEADEVHYTSRWKQWLCRRFGHRKLVLTVTRDTLHDTERVLEWQCKRCYLRTLPFGIDSMNWFEYIRKHYLCANCKTPLVQHQEGKCLFIPSAYFEIEEYLVQQHLLQQGEDASMENVRLQKKRWEADFRRGVL